MKKDFALFILIAMLFAPIVLYTKIIVDYEEMKNEFVSEREIKNKKIEELEKEIRIMKQDIFVLQYGYEYEEK